MRIDREFKQLIPALTNDELVLLESNILEDGCRDPLTVWQEESVLLDGHNRYEICSKHDIEFDVNYISLPDRQHAINWIINNQLGRRNVTPDQASYLRGKRYNMEKGEYGGDRKSSDQNDHLNGERTSERLAEEFKVSAPTIRRDGKFADAIDSLSDVIGDNVRQAVLSGDNKIPKQDVISAAAWMVVMTAAFSLEGV